MSPVLSIISIVIIRRHIFIVVLNLVMLNVIMPSDAFLTVIMLGVTFFKCYAKSHSAECHYAKCRYADCRFDECLGAKSC